MSKAQWKALALSLVAVLTTIILAIAATASITLAQVTSVTQFRDVQPTDYYYEALRNLVERYGCIAGYDDGTFRGDRPATRGELAENLSACLNQVSRIAATSGESPQEDQASIASLEEKVQSLQQAVESIRRSREGVPSNERI